MSVMVKLRRKVISEKMESLYLDYYPAIINEITGKKTRRKFLKLQLNNEYEYQEQKYADGNGKEQRRFVPVLNKQGNRKKIKLSEIDKRHNKETLLLAEGIRQKVNNQLNKNEIYSGLEKEQLRINELGDGNFVKYFEKQAKRSDTPDNWLSAYKHFVSFAGSHIRFVDLTPQFCKDYRSYILNAKSLKKSKKPLHINTRSSYFNKFKETLRQAFKDEILQNDLNAKVDTIKPIETERGFLSLEEVVILTKTDCSHPLLRKAAFFSIMTGLAFAEIKNLEWGNIRHSTTNGYSIPYRRQKTGKFDYLPISDKAYKVLGESKAVNDKVFEGLNNKIRYDLFPKWLKAAGITRYITFHGLRHTYAVLQIEMGTDIYVLSKMLNHKNVKTTQVYSRIADKSKKTAADRIDIDVDVDV